MKITQPRAIGAAARWQGFKPQNVPQRIGTASLRGVCAPTGGVDSSTPITVSPRLLGAAVDNVGLVTGSRLDVVAASGSGGGSGKLGSAGVCTSVGSTSSALSVNRNP